MRVEECTMLDVPLLTVMNKRLIEDEGSSNAMSLRELDERMRGFLAEDYKAYLFISEADVVGYALVRHGTDPLYLRQFYIEREHRRMHIGEQAFGLLMEHLDTAEIAADVLPHNGAGRAFRKSRGFKETYVKENYISMRYQNKQ